MIMFNTYGRLLLTSISAVFSKCHSCTGWVRRWGGVREGEIIIRIYWIKNLFSVRLEGTTNIRDPPRTPQELYFLP